MPNIVGKIVLAALMAGALALSASPGWTQETPEPEAQEPGPQEPQTQEPRYEQREPPYEPQFLRLSEILGAVHYLRQLCDSDEGSLWRDQMQGLIESESPSPIRRAKIIDRFNRGYESFRSVYRTCTPAAAFAIDRYMEEGAKIARDVATRYGK